MIGKFRESFDASDVQIPETEISEDQLDEGEAVRSDKWGENSDAGLSNLAEREISEPFSKMNEGTTEHFPEKLEGHPSSVTLEDGTVVELPKLDEIDAEQLSDVDVCEGRQDTGEVLKSDEGEKREPRTENGEVRKPETMTAEKAEKIFVKLFDKETSDEMSDEMSSEDMQDDSEQESSLEKGDETENVDKAEEYYSDYEERLKQTPLDGERGTWDGERGESKYTPSSQEIKDILAKYGSDGIKYKDGIPDFSEVSESTVEIENMTENRAENFKQCDEKCAEQWNKEARDGKTDWTPRDVAQWRKANGYSWHERNDMKTCDLIPTKVNDYFGHLGGVSECKKRDAENSGGEFDE